MFLQLILRLTGVIDKQLLTRAVLVSNYHFELSYHD